MKGIRFYEEFKDSRKRKSAGNIFALDIDPRYPALFGTGALFDEPDSPVCGASVSHEWLRKRTKRVSEAHARTVHPTLFAWLDSFTDDEE